ncbi:hypothetical protein [Nonomuraea sp. NPDC001699]
MTTIKLNAAIAAILGLAWPIEHSSGKLGCREYGVVTPRLNRAPKVIVLGV